MSCCPPPRGPRRSAPSPTPIAWCSSDARRSSRRATRRTDFWILNELARRMGLDWYYDHPRDVFNEMRTCMDSIAGITWERLERESSVTYPCVQGRRSGRSGRLHRQLPDAHRTRQVRAGRPHLRGGAAGRRVPDGAHHRPAARTLAHRIDDAPRVEPRLHRAGAGGVGASARSRSDARSRRAASSRSNRGAAASRSTRAPTMARRAARCSCRSAITRRRRTC